jgi:4-hydroxy-2-oxoheptanedioate aldolase
VLKQSTIEGRTVYGIWQRIPDSTVSEILALSGIDFVAIDMEHGAIDIADLRTMVPHFKLANVPVILRIASADSAFVAKVLDLGIDGIMVPQIATVEEARNVVKVSKFAPLGARGVGGACSADRFGQISVEEFVRSQNNHVMTIVQVENEQCIHNLDQILEVEGIDLFYIGPFDLSQSLGVTAQINHPDVTAAIQTVIDKCKAKGKAIGMHGVSPEFIQKWREHGVSLFTYGMDSALLKQTVQKEFAALR